MSASTQREPLVLIRGLNKSFGSFQALTDIDLEVQDGEVMCLIGPSGSGKSTLLRCINQLEQINAGAIWVNGQLMGFRHRKDTLCRLGDKEVSLQRREIGMVFQKFNLFPHLTVLQNVIEGPVNVLGEDVTSASARALALLEQVGLPDKRDAYPSELSGGQQQRVAIARGLAMRPRLMLFDEPTSALDPELVGEVLAAMKQLAASGMTMIVVTHELGFAREVADTVAFMEAGRIVETGRAADVLSTPTQARTMQFISAVRN